MPRNIVDNPSAGHAFVEKCKRNDLRVVCCLTKPDEFVKYAGVDGLLEFYRLFIFRTNIIFKKILGINFYGK